MVVLPRVAAAARPGDEALAADNWLAAFLAGFISLCQASATVASTDVTACSSPRSISMSISISIEFVNAIIDVALINCYQCNEMMHNASYAFVASVQTLHVMHACTCAMCIARGSLPPDCCELGRGFLGLCLRRATPAFRYS